MVVDHYGHRHEIADAPCALVAEEAAGRAVVGQGRGPDDAGRTVADRSPAGAASAAAAIDTHTFGRNGNPAPIRPAVTTVTAARVMNELTTTTSMNRPRAQVPRRR